MSEGGVDTGPIRISSKESGKGILSKIGRLNPIKRTQDRKSAETADRAINFLEKRRLATKAHDAEVKLDHANKEVVKLEALAHVDPLTGLPNRRALEAELTTETDQATRRQIEGLKPQVVFGIMMDLDHFKWLNEAVGHPVADDILKAMWLINMSESRAGEDIHRYGGEEFFKVLHDIDEADIPAITARINERMRGLSQLILRKADHLNHEYEKPEFAQFSFGVTQLKPGDTPETFKKRADAALNRVKETERGTTLIADSDDDGKVTAIRQPGISESPSLAA